MVVARKPAALSSCKTTDLPRTVDVLNVNTPGKAQKRDRVKYELARKTFLKVLPAKGPGVTQAEMMALMKDALSAEVFGTTTGWWTKTVQLDGEARGEVVRDGGKPLRWRKVR